MKKMLMLGILVTVVLGWVSLSYKTQDVSTDAAALTPSSQTGWPFSYKDVRARGLCEGSISTNPQCDPPTIYNYYSLAGDILLCLIAGALTSLTAYRLSRFHK